MSSTPQEPTEEELRAAWEEQLRQIKVSDVLLQTAVSLINLAGRRLGVAPGTEGERDLDQVRDAIDGVRALTPLLERAGGEDLAPLRDAVAQLQLEYARSAAQDSRKPGPGEPAATGAEQPAGAKPDEPEGPGPAQSSGRLWVPGS